MAVKWLTGTGNWSDTSKWVGGTLPVAGDTVYLNSYNIAVDVDVSLGGYGIDYDLAPSACVVGGYYTIKSVGTTNWVSMGAAGNVEGTRFLCQNSGSGTGVATTRGTVINAAFSSLGIAQGGIATINGGNTLRADAENQGGSSVGVVTFSEASPAEGWWYGTAYGGNNTSRWALAHTSSGTFNATGVFYGASLTGSAFGIAVTGSGLTRITGSAYGRVSSAISLSGTGTVEVTLTDCIGSGVSSAQHGMIVGGNCYVSGSVANAVGGILYDSRGVNVTANSAAVSLTGNAVGGSAGATTVGIGLAGNSLFLFSGTVTGGGSAVGALNTSGGGTLSVTKCVGAATGSFAGLSGTNVSATTVFKDSEYGAQGAPPTSGHCFLNYDSVGGNSVTIRQSSGGPSKTFVDAVRIPSAVPANADVRNGVSFNFGNNTGTCHVPAAASVAAGVPVDNTVGTAVLTPAAVQAIVGAIVADAIDS